MPTQTFLEILSRPASQQRTNVAGLGCRKGCSRAELEQLLRQVLREHRLPVEALSYLASSEHKASETGLSELAEHLQLPVVWLSAEQLAPYDGVLSEKSLLSKQLTGSAGVAEASALAQAELVTGQKAQLLGTKLRSANATCALATALFP
jgi:cobalt-precorrin 5A hydrolase